jgi:capsule polysaccharide export protein KpsE/RkpR
LAHTEIKQKPDVMPELIIREKDGYQAMSSQPSDMVFQRLRTLWDNRGLLARAAFIGSLFGLLLAFLIPTRYQSTTQLMPPDNQSTSGMAMLASLSAKGGSPLGAMAGDLLGLQGSGDLFIGLLRSRTLEDRLVSRFDLQRVYGKRLEEDARKKLEENTSVNQDRKSGIITITVTDHDPKRATAMAQAYIEELDRLVADVATSAARRERIFLEQRLQAVKVDLDQAERDFGQFSSKNGAIDIKEQGRAMLDAAATLMGQLIAAESELRGLEAIYVPSNVHIRSIQARITELRSELEKMGGEKGFSIEGEDPAAHSTYPSIRQLPLLGETYADLYRRTKIQEAVYETLTQQYELVKVQEAKETPSVKVLDFAKLPQRKSYPPRLEIVILCCALALMGSVIWILGYTRWAEINELHPGKVLAIEVYHAVRSSAETIRRDKWAVITKRHWPTRRNENSGAASDPAESTNTSDFEVRRKADAS